MGSPVMVVDFDNSTVVKEFKYDSFGNILEEKGDFEIPFRFAGGIYDEDTKLTRFGVRDYDSETGRWTDKEPLGFAGSRNFYVYSYSNPINWFDINGLKPGDPFKTVDEAAKDAMTYIYEESNMLQKEMGGIIYKGDNGCYYASEPNLGGDDELNFPPSLLINAVADYHSHVRKNDDEDFSNDDIFGNLYNGIDGYLINQYGEISKFNYTKNVVTNLKTGVFIMDGIDSSNIEEYYQWLLE